MARGTQARGRLETLFEAIGRATLWMVSGAGNVAWGWARKAPKRTLFATAALLAPVAFGFAFWGIRKDLVSRPGFSVDLTRVSFDPVPEWIAPWAVAEMSRILTGGGRETAASIFDEGLPRRVALRLSAVPWLRQVKQVRKQGMRFLSLDLEWRVPFAFVAYGGRSVLIDRDGVVLPVSCYDPARLRLPSITGIVGHPPAAGGAWHTPELQAARDLLGQLEFHGLARAFPSARPVSIEAGTIRAGYAPRAAPEMVLRTERGVPILMTFRQGPGRLPIGEQVQNLKAVLASDPELVQVKQYVDLRFAQPTWH